jgi:hypothetical protein
VESNEDRPTQNKIDEAGEKNTLSDRLLEQIFELWVEPELTRRRFELDPDQIMKVLVEINPAESRPIVKINDEAELLIEFTATRKITNGEAFTEADIDQVHSVRPAQIGENSGWICFAVIRGRHAIAFDFRYNWSRALRLIQRAREFLTVARNAATNSPGVACDNAFSAAELSVQAQMLLRQQDIRQHWRRQEWFDSWTELDNSPNIHSLALRELHGYRAAAHYADADLVIPKGRLVELLDTNEEMIKYAAQRAGEA